MRLSSIVLLTAGLVLPCCEDQEEKKEKLRADLASLKAEFAPTMGQLATQVEAARRAALELPPLAAAPSPWPGPPLAATNGFPPGGNAVVMLRGAGLCEADFPGGEPFRFCGGNPFCSRHSFPDTRVELANTLEFEFPQILKNAREGFTQATRLRYAAFVETREFRKPVLLSNAFRGGLYRAEVRVYALEPLTYLGGFEVHSKSDGVIGYGGSTRAASALARDFRDNTVASFNKAMARFSGAPSKLEVGDTLSWD